MSEEDENEQAKDKAIYSTIREGGQKKILSDAPFLVNQVKLERSEKREDLTFFIIFTFMMLDFVFFATLKNYYLPLSLCLMQAVSLCFLAHKKGWRQSWRLVNDFSVRIIGDSGTKFNKKQKSSPVESDKSDRLDDLSRELGSIQTARNQNCFIFIVLNFIFIDVVFFSVLNTWAAPVALLILEGFILFVLGEKMGMKSICVLISKLLGIAADKLGGKK